MTAGRLSLNATKQQATASEKTSSRYQRTTSWMTEAAEAEVSCCRESACMLRFLLVDQIINWCDLYVIVYLEMVVLHPCRLIALCLSRIVVLEGALREPWTSGERGGLCRGGVPTCINTVASSLRLPWLSTRTPRYNKKRQMMTFFSQNPSSCSQQIANVVFSSRSSTYFLFAI